VSIPTARNYQIDMARTSGAVNVDADFRFFVSNGQFFSDGVDETDDTETLTVPLQVRDYFISAFDFNNISSDTGQDSCYSFTIQ
jgi:hypothetical protein